MRELSCREQMAVAGGLRIVLPIAGAIAWGFANRAALIEIGRAAKARDAQLTAEH